MADKSARPSPAKSATAFKVGHRMKGNDGSMYVIAAASNGVKRWRQVKDDGDLKRARIVITPTLSPTRETKEIKAATHLANKKNEHRFEDLVGPKALKIVRHALSWVKGSPVDGGFGDVDINQVLTVAFDMAKLQYIVDVAYEGTPRDLKAMADDILFSGYSGADTWMEGDIRVSADHELFLKLARVATS